MLEYKYFVSVCFQFEDKSDDKIYFANCENNTTRKIRNLEDIIDIEKSIELKMKCRKGSLKILNYREF